MLAFLLSSPDRERSDIAWCQQDISATEAGLMAWRAVKIIFPCSHMTIDHSVRSTQQVESAMWKSRS